MKVLHINSDIIGGAGIASYRLHQGLLKHGIDSKFLVGNASNCDDRISIIPSKFVAISKKLNHFNARLGLNYIHLLNTFNITKCKSYQEADVLNFHNLHGGYFNYLAISKLTQDKPSVFTLHDMWSFTGHCAYSYDCDRWEIGCGKCPYPSNYPAFYHRDNTRIEWKLKDWIYSKSNLSIVTLSSWLTEKAKSSMLKRFPIHHIPNGIDTNAFKPLDPTECKKNLNIPTNKKVLLFAAASLQDSRKGGDLLIKALKKLPSSLKAETILLTFGYECAEILSDLDMQTISLGYINSDFLKSIAFSASDLFVFPTRADNLPLVLQESMSCGTPMVSFHVGGVPDLVRPNVTGYLAQAEDIDDFCKGIIMLLEDEQLRLQMSKNCRSIAIAEYSIEKQAEKYTGLYESFLF
ncbi:glycosyltransferase family 4 protein [Pseudanabaena sp. FACHB-1998]|uniref:glycosyltransferase family 4 protein n=1 Tax=Pseudanabaena sp. FACHB-1998 TaxID=2692858 RepID=UPI001681681F|nr:glycosyltransferase family 4 protein [Pseudanabaena sp. FACHB-1998]MBD2176641.1 glycosyltransferase family 4 protein [Pseudanabaena sp. FACHB-1998]